MERQKKRRLTVLLICFLLVWLAAGAQAAEKMAIQKCTISANRSTVEVSAAGPSSVGNTDGNYYLFALMPYESRVSSASLLAGTCAQKGAVRFRAFLNAKSQNSLLYRKFVIAVREKGSGRYTIVSDARYITNPQRLAKYTGAFPKAASKKGLHIQPDMLSDAEDLGIKHAVVNICLDTFVATPELRNAAGSYSYTYQGKQYWFARYACEEVDRQVSKLSQTGVIVSGILLLREERGGAVLVAPNARGSGKPYYGFNTMNREGVETLAALMTFLGERYSAPSGKNGRIVNWIVGNEVNDYGRYNYLGNLSFNQYMEAYARSFRVVSTALHSVYSKARVYISLDHCWNIIQPDGQSYTSKRVLDKFASVIEAQGDINWNLAFHPYPAPLTDPAFWDDNVSDTDATKTVTMKNIGYLTGYVGRKFRRDVRVILSEQGFTSNVAGVTKEKRQAAAFAYAYYITEFNDKIDSFIMNRHVDHIEEMKQGLYLGLWTNKQGNLEYAARKKEIYDVFKYIDSASSKSVTAFALPYIGATSWSAVIPGFSWSRFAGMGSYKNGKAVSSLSGVGALQIKGSPKYGYNGSVQKSGTTTTVTVNEKANPNLYQGAGWTFSKKLNFSARSRFLCKLKISGMRENYAHVRIRFFSGRNVYEASANVAGGVSRVLSVDLSKWKYRKTVSKIQIWVRPYKKTKWKSGGKITITAMQQAKKTR